MKQSIKIPLLLLGLLVLGGLFAYMIFLLFFSNGSPETPNETYSPIVPDVAPGTKYTVKGSDDITEDMTLQELTEMAEEIKKPIPKKKEGNPVADVNEFDHADAEAAAEPPITMFYYIDITDTFSKLMYPRVQEFAQKHRNNVSLVIRHYPLSTRGELSYDTAVLIECAVQASSPNVQFNDLIDAMADARLRNQGDVDAVFASFNVDTASLEECTSDNQMKLIPSFHKTKGRQHGIAGAPSTVFQDNETNEVRVVSGIASDTLLLETLDAMLK